MRNPKAIHLRHLALFVVFLPSAFASLAESSSTSDKPAPGGRRQLLSSADQAPEGIGKSDWQSIRAAHEAWKHSFQPAEGGYTARTPGMQWRSHFDARGFLTQPTAEGGWQWGLELRCYGFRGQEQPAPSNPETVADGQRLARTWDANLTEWHVNDGRGLEHGFTLTQRPPGADSGAPLCIELAVRGTLRPQVQADGQSVNFADASGATALKYGGLKVWDADGKVLPARMAATATATGGLRFEIVEKYASYPLIVDPIAQIAYLKAGNNGDALAGDFFGHAIAVSGDTVIVGSPYEDGGGTGVNPVSNEDAALSGAAYIFFRSGTEWTQQAYFKASNASAGDAFGWSVAILGDTAVVGARREDGSGSGVNPLSDENAADAGAAYVFVRNGTEWSQQAVLKASNTGAGDLFGSSVAVSGETVFVGADHEDGSGTGVNPAVSENASDSGAAYAFVRDGVVWSQAAYLKASNTGAGDNFGWSAAVSGNTVIFGAPYEDGGGTGANPGSNENAPDAGAVCVFVGNGGVWTQQAYLKAFNSDTGDNFGFSVAVWDDTVVVGAVQEDGSGTGVNPPSNESAASSGAAYVFVRNGTVWSHHAYLKASNSGAGDRFGDSVAVFEDTVAVGAPFENGSGLDVNPASNESASDAGAAYVFVRDGTLWSQQAYLKASNTGVDDYFGHSIAVAGDIVIVGASWEDGSGGGVNPASDESGYRAGAGYAFVRSGAGWSRDVYLKAGNNGPAGFGPGDHFGFSVAASGDTVVVGAYLEDGSGTGVNAPDDEMATDAGAAYVFIRSGSGWSQQAYLKASNTGAGDEFGWSVAVSENIVVVGAPRESGSGTGVNPASNESAVFAGAAYVFARSGNVWLSQGYLKASNSGIGHRFGSSVAVSDETIIVGAADGENGTGAAYVFVRGGADWRQQACLKSANSTGAFGSELGIWGDTAAVGATEEVDIFVRRGAEWHQQACLKASNAEQQDKFGTSSVAVSEDTVVVGAYQEDSGGAGVNPGSDESALNAGAAYVFVRNGTVWHQQAYLKASNTGASDNFGYSAAVSGDTVIVGAYSEDGGGTGLNPVSDESVSNAGAAYVFVRNGTEWSQRAYLKASNTDERDHFGSSVAVSGDTLVVGAEGESGGGSGVDPTSDESASGAGAAYVFGGVGLNAIQTWRQSHFGTPENVGSAENFFDADGDGLPNLIEFAFGLHPLLVDAGRLPQPQHTGSAFSVTFPQPAGVSGITYAAEWSSTLQPGSWTPITDSGTGSTHTFMVPAGGNSRMFMRFSVAKP